MDKKIKVGFCAAYDWYFLKQSLPPVYESADVICIAVDQDRISWSGKPFSIDEAAFAAFLKEVDKDNKILLYEDDFHRPELSPMQNEVRQRNMMALAMGKGGWHLQLDSDEYFIDFPGFVAFLKRHTYQRPVNIACPLLILYKIVDNGFLLIETPKTEQIEYIAIATNEPHYEYGRKNGYFNIKTDFAIVHQSWARSEAEVQQKVQNWGHKEDFDVQAYYESWKGLNGTNYKRYLNFHPITPGSWASLQMVAARSIAGLISYFRQHPPLTIPKSYLRKENSIWRSRIKAVLKKLG